MATVQTNDIETYYEERGTGPPVRLVGYQRVEKAMVWLRQQVQGERVSGDSEKIERLRAEGPKMETD